MLKNGLFCKTLNSKNIDLISKKLIVQNYESNLTLKRCKHLGITTLPKYEVIKIWEGMSIDDLSSQTKLSKTIIKDVMKKNNILGFSGIEALKILATELERKYTIVKNPNSKSLPVNDECLLEKFKVPLGDEICNKVPVVTIMGHVDHGKTTLLDSLRFSEIVENEFGGITQHTGAFVVSLNQNKKIKKNKKSLLMNEDISNLITFLDTPGHAAFTKMRERGAKITDFIILVIAAEDGLMPQTIESINFALKYNVPLIVALNKIDKLDNLKEKDVEAIIKKIENNLLENKVELESLGGDVQLIKISALEKIGLDDLKEAILAQAELLNLKSTSNKGVRGTIIESSLDKQKGKLTTILVENGTLKKGDVIVTENQLAYAKVRAIFDENTQLVDKIRPGFSVQIVGWKTNEYYFPEAGDKVIQVMDERSAIKLQDEAVKKLKLDLAKKTHQVYKEKMEEHNKSYKEFLKNKLAEKKRWFRYQTPVEKFSKFNLEEENKKINLIIKADTFGTLETILELLSSYPEEKGIRFNLLSYGVGNITENDFELATTFYQPIVISFNTNYENENIKIKFKENKLKTKVFNVIYQMVDYLKLQIENKLPEEEQHDVVGEAVVLQIFSINERSKKVTVAGSLCEKGVLKNDFSVFYKVVRDGQTIEKNLRVSSMRHLKDEVSQIKEKMECGLMFKEYKDVFKPGDKIICYKPFMKKCKSNWQPEGF